MRRTEDVRGAAAVPAHEERVRLLGEVSTGGLPALLHVMRRAHTGEDPAARLMTLSSLLRALPGMGAVTVHELIAAEGIGEGVLVGDVPPGELGALLRTLDRLDRA